MKLRRIHRWLGAALLLPLLVWMATGALFFVKPGWDQAYESLSAFRLQNAQPAGAMPLAALAEQLRDENPSSIQLRDSVLGPLYLVHGRDGAAIYDGASGERLDPLGEVEARALMSDAVAFSPHRERYGELRAPRLDGEQWLVTTSTGVELRLDGHSARMSQEGPDTRRIGWLYRLHYLQWTGNQTVDRILGVGGLLLLAGLTLMGAILLRRRE